MNCQNHPKTTGRLEKRNFFSAPFVVAAAVTFGCAPASVRTNQEFVRQWTDTDTSLSGRFTDVNVNPWVDTRGVSISVDGVAICQVEQTDWVQFRENTVRETDPTLLFELFGMGAGLVVVGAILLSADEETVVDGTVTDTSAAADFGLALTLAGLVPVGVGIGSVIRASDDLRLMTPTIRDQTVTEESCGPRVPATQMVVSLVVADDGSLLDSGRTNAIGQVFFAPEINEMGAVGVSQMANLSIEAGDTQLPLDLSDWSPYIFARTQWLLNTENSPTVSDLAEFIEEYPDHPDIGTFSVQHEDQLWQQTISYEDSTNLAMVANAYDHYLVNCILCDSRDEAEQGLLVVEAALQAEQEAALDRAAEMVHRHEQEMAEMRHELEDTAVVRSALLALQLTGATDVSCAGESGRTFLYQAAGYGPGMDPFYFRLSLEEADLDLLVRVFRFARIQVGRMGDYAVMRLLSGVLCMTATEASDLYYLLYDYSQLLNGP